MRIAIGHIEETSLETYLARIRQAEADGFPTVTIANIFDFDALMLCALAGRETTTVELMTAVVPTFPRHPHAVAQQALTAQAATNGRLALGVGISHQVVIEAMLGLSYDKPVRHLREYLEVLNGLLENHSCEVDGEMYRVHAQIGLPDVPAPPVLIGALRPQMIKLAGRMTDGTITWMAGPTYLERDIVGPMNAAAAEAGRSTPRTVAGVPICVTSDRDTAREEINGRFAIYGNLPVYRAVLDAEGADGPADIAIVGDEAEVEAGLRRLKDAGVTDFGASIVGTGSDPKAAHQRTYEFLASLAPEL